MDDGKKEGGREIVLTDNLLENGTPGCHSKLSEDEKRVHSREPPKNVGEGLGIVLYSVVSWLRSSTCSFDIKFRICKQRLLHHQQAKLFWVRRQKQAFIDPDFYSLRRLRFKLSTQYECFCTDQKSVVVIVIHDRRHGNCQKCQNSGARPCSAVTDKVYAMKKFKKAKDIMQTKR